MSSNVSEAVIHDPPSDPEMSTPKTCPVMDPNPIIIETACTDSDVSSSQKDALLNVHVSVAVTAHETENKSCSTLNAAAPNEAHHSAIEVPDESNRDSLDLPENMSYVSNNDQQPDSVLMDADFHSDPLSTSDILDKFDDNLFEESKHDDLMSSVIHPHHLVMLSRFLVRCDKYILIKVRSIVFWVYEDPTLFRGGGWTRETYIPDIRSGSSKKGRCWGIQKIPQKLSNAIPE
ncbi:unnamed protein product [Schistosoma spindalis]|nr:unnamed protein product [Schistosoma spindale]